MKKKIGISAFGVMLIVLFVLLMTARETGKKERPLGYEDVDSWDIYETGRMKDDFTMGPISEEFLEFKETAEGAEARYRTKTFRDEHGLGLIPSPIPEEIHDGLRAKTDHKSLYDDVYDLRDPDNDGNRSDSLLPPAREQWDCGACWAFSSYGAIESLLYSRMGYLADFSENHPLFESGYDWSGCQGGNADMMMAYLSREGGPVNETDDPFTKNPSGACGDCEPVRYIDSIVKLKVRSSVSDILYIKQALLDYGPLYVALNWSSRYYNSGDFTYRSETYGANHAVTLVGWDDTKHPQGAVNPGVFIARNSWGSDWGDDGYFYVAYEDKSFAFSSVVAVKDTPDSLLPFDRIYYHDDLGMTSSTGYGNNQAWGASAYTPDTDGALVAVGLFTTAQETHYQVTVFDRMENGRLKQPLGKSLGGTLSGRGYHTIRLEQPISLNRGDRFIIAVKFHTPSSNWPVPLERPFPDYSSAAYARPGETYLSSDGRSWADTTAYFTNTSVCIKALVREEGCDDNALTLSGPGHEGIFLTPTKNGTWVTAVVTSGCGAPIFDAEVIASLGTEGPDLILYDDGEHQDGNFDDGIYANEVTFTSSLDSSSVKVKATAEGREIFKAGTIPEPESGSGGGGSGCFIGHIK